MTAKADYEGLSYLAGSYCNQDWKVEYSTPQECVADYKQDSQRSGLIDRTIADLDAVLASPISEEELDRLWIYELHGGYDPADDGLTYRQWFTEVRRLLTE